MHEPTEMKARTRWAILRNVVPRLTQTEPGRARAPCTYRTFISVSSCIWRTSHAERIEDQHKGAAHATFSLYKPGVASVLRGA